MQETAANLKTAFTPTRITLLLTQTNAQTTPPTIQNGRYLNTEEILIYLFCLRAVKIFKMAHIIVEILDASVTPKTPKNFDRMMLNTILNMIPIDELIIGCLES